MNPPYQKTLHGASVPVLLQLAPGQYDLSGEVDDRLRIAAAAPPREDDRAHPIFAFIMALGGMEIPVASLFERVGLRFDTGAVLGSCAIRWERPLIVGRRYSINAVATGIKRKPSRRFGAADHLSLRMTISCAGEGFADVETITIVPVAEACS